MTPREAEEEEIADAGGGRRGKMIGEHLEFVFQASPNAIGREVAMSRFSLKVNGQVHAVDADPEAPLLYVLRDTLTMNNPRFGCGLGQCGACTVLVENRAVRSCLLPVSRAAGKEIVTLEGLAGPSGPHPVQAAFIEEQAFQCGYCLNGWVMTTKALLDATPHPSDEEMRKAFESLVCRCGSHVRIFASVRRAAGMAQSTQRSA